MGFKDIPWDGFATSRSGRSANSLDGMRCNSDPVSGYSVFVVQQFDQDRPLALARTEADRIAGTIPEITGSASRPTLSTARTVGKAVAPGPSNSAFNFAGAGLEDEDLELQEALQASLQENTSTTANPRSPQPNPTRTSTSTSDWDFPTTRRAFGTQVAAAAPPSTAHLHSLDSSARRAREELARFQREQEEALRETYDEEIALGNRSPALGSASTAHRRAVQPDEEEEEMLRRAIEASRQDSAPVPEHPASRVPVVEQDDDDSFDDDDYMDIDDEEDEKAYLAKVMKERQEHQQMLANAGRTGANSYGSPITSAVPRAALHRVRPAYQGLGLSGIAPRVSDAPPVIPPLVGVTGSNASHLEDARYYDDEDEMLQAALKASLEDAPVDFVVPEPSQNPITPEVRGASSTSTPTLSASNQPPVTPALKTTAKSNDESEEEEEEEEEASKPLTAEQLRAARLARFGG